MDKERRRELQEAYRQVKTHMGVAKITNTQNGKVFVAAYPNLKNKWQVLQNQLDMGRHPNAALQSDWKEYGAVAFTYEVVDEKEVDADTDARAECRELEQLWRGELGAYGQAGYHKRK